MTSMKKRCTSATIIVVAALSLLFATCTIAFAFLWRNSYSIYQQWSKETVKNVYQDSEEHRIWIVHSICGKLAFRGTYNPQRQFPSLKWTGKLYGPGQLVGPVRRYYDLAEDCEYRAVGFGYNHETDPVNVISIVIPYWFLEAVSAVITAVTSIVLYRHIRFVWPNSRGLCPKCGYDLRASNGGCPECGTSVHQRP